MQLWKGRFKKELSKTTNDFNSSISFDSRMYKEDGKSQAVTDTKLEELTREVREHNNFARRVPILEEQMKVANHRIADLEKERN